MKFPPEIRNMIYRHYLPKPGFYGKTKAMYPADKKTTCACSHVVPNSWQRKTYVWWLCSQVLPLFASG